MSQSHLDSRQKVPFVCFDCRTAIKLALTPYGEEIAEKSWASQKNAVCPRCKKPLAYVGRYFKVPPRTALNQWRKAELLWRNGWIADGYSSSPQTLRDAREFIQVAGRSPRRSKAHARNEERWRRLRAQREHLRRHKAA